MPTRKNNLHKIILAIIYTMVIILGILLFFIPPALFPDPANGFQVLRCMQLGGPFNTMIAPDQSDIAQNYSEYLTWWSPGQYLIPYVFKVITALSLGRGTAITITVCQLFGIAGFYKFFRKVGFTPLISAISVGVIVCQLAFFVPYVFYNGGEVLLFAFEGWFLYGCISLKKADFKLLLFVLLAGWLGFFLKSSFIWMYLSGLACLWVRLFSGSKEIIGWIRKGLWIGIPAIISLVCIYVFFLSKGQSPATQSKGLKITAETFSFPLSTPLLSGFSLDDYFHGLIFHFGKQEFSHAWAIAILVVLALVSLALVLYLLKKVPDNNYRLFLGMFYFGAWIFFSFIYLKQLNISYEARHFRIIGIIFIPGIIYLLSQAPKAYRFAFGAVMIGILAYSLNYAVKGFTINGKLAARGPSGLAQVNIDQQALDTIVQIDQKNRNATFVFVSNDTGLEITHNRIINLPAIPDNLKIDPDDYNYDGYSGPLYIVLPAAYKGNKADLMMKSFPEYKNFRVSQLSQGYIVCLGTKR